MQPDRPHIGILLTVAFCAMAPLGDAVAKLLSGTVPLGQILVVRFGMQAALLLPLALATGRDLGLRPGLLAFAALRTAVHVAALAIFFVALRYLPLADALAMVFVMPFILLLMGRLLLGEEVGPRRLAACAAGFAGTLMVLQPSVAAVGPVALLPLGVAVLFALFMLITRRIARETDPIGLQAVSGLMATGTVALAQVAGLLGTAAWIAPTPGQWTLLAVLGLLGTGGHLLITWALRFAPAATVAPVQYLEIPFATVIGWLIFRDLPDGLAALGIAVIMASGLYVVARERSLARAAATAA